MVKAKIHLVMDVIFEKDINIGEVSELLGKEPDFVLEKGKKYFFQRGKSIWFFSMRFQVWRKERRIFRIYRGKICADREKSPGFGGIYGRKRRKNRTDRIFWKKAETFRPFCSRESESAFVPVESGYLFFFLIYAIRAKTGRGVSDRCKIGGGAERGTDCRRREGHGGRSV